MGSAIAHKFDFMLGSPAQSSKGSTLPSGIVEKLTLAPCAIAHKIDFMHARAAQCAKESTALCPSDSGKS